MSDPRNTQLADLSIGRSSIFQKFKRMVEKYAKLNEIPLHNNERDYDAMLFSFLKDPRFIDFALDECGIKFNSEVLKFDTVIPKKDKISNP
ncbi:MAG: hypothetical protein ACM3JQ_03440 [Candidatus Eiseniibacteriota bacterium]